MSDYGNEDPMPDWWTRRKVEYDGPEYVGEEQDEPELVDEEEADDEYR